MKERGKPIAFVVPRFGREIAGGAETLVAGLARELARSGYSIEIFTTCARDNRTWDNHFEPGSFEMDGLQVHRYSVSPRDLETWIPLQIRISDGFALSLDEQLAWMQNSVLSNEMLLDIEKRADEFRWLIFAPYLFGTTFWGSLVRPDKSLLLPCLHDESYARLDVTRAMFESVQGAVFNAAPEGDLAERLFGHIAGAEVGMGFDEYASFEYREREPYFDEGFPYIFYLGRKETGKNAQLLVEYFTEYKQQRPGSDLRLVIAGGGDYSDLGFGEKPNRPDIIDLEQVSEEEKLSLLQNAELLVQPSVNESFSIVIMEAWLTKTPCLVHSQCDVTRYHCEQSQGGLYFGSQAEFAACVDEVCGNPELGKRFAERGRDYVLRQYCWKAVVERFESCLKLIESHQVDKSAKQEQIRIAN